MFTELSANILYLDLCVCVYVCLCIHRCMYSMLDEHVVTRSSRRIGAVSLMYLGCFFFCLSRTSTDSSSIFPTTELSFAFLYMESCGSCSIRCIFTLGPQMLAALAVRCFGGVKIKKCLHASLPVYLRVSLSLGDNHGVSLVFLLLISVRRRMVVECQLSLKHLFPANNSLCRCLVLAEGSPIASSLLTQNNNADECHLLLMLFFLSPRTHCL